MNLTGWILFYFNSRVLEVTESLLYSIQRRGMMKFYHSWSEDKTYSDTSCRESRDRQSTRSRVLNCIWLGNAYRNSVTSCLFIISEVVTDF